MASNTLSDVMRSVADNMYADFAASKAVAHAGTKGTIREAVLIGDYILDRRGAPIGAFHTGDSAPMIMLFLRRSVALERIKSTLDTWAASLVSAGCGSLAARARQLAGGATVEQLPEDYPCLEREDVSAASLMPLRSSMEAGLRTYNVMIAASIAPTLDSAAKSYASHGEPVGRRGDLECRLD